MLTDAELSTSTRLTCLPFITSPSILWGTPWVKGGLKTGNKRVRRGKVLFSI